MDDDEWEVVGARLDQHGAKSLVTAIPRRIYERAQGHGARHPVSQILHGIGGGDLPPFVCKTAVALRRIAAWLTSPAGQEHGSWWVSVLKRLEERADQASGALAEIRAFGALLSTADSPTDGLSPRPIPRRTSKTPDFAIGRSHDVFVEVRCARMNDLERERQAELDDADEQLTEAAMEAAREILEVSPLATQVVHATATREWSGEEGDRPAKVRRHQVRVSMLRRADGTPASITFTTRDHRPQGPTKGTARRKSVPYTVASILAGKKPKAEQIPENRPGIFWLDLSDPEWSIRTAEAAPVELLWKGMSFASTPGVWHSFYGRKDRSPLMVRAAVAFPLDDEHVKLDFDGRFWQPSGHRWSAAVLRCADGLVIFENPNASLLLPFDVLRELVALDGVDRTVSYFRFFEDDLEGLRRRIEDTEHELAFYVS